MILPDQTTLWLLVALLLLFWLLTRVHARESAPKRRMPMSPDELGRAVFEVVRADDVHGYRALFLAGGEARAVLGEGAERYLERRTWDVLMAAMAALKGELSDRCHYRCFLLGENGEGYMEVQLADGSQRPVAVGAVAQVGAVWRIVHAPGARV